MTGLYPKLAQPTPGLGRLCHRLGKLSTRIITVRKMESNSTHIFVQQKKFRCSYKHENKLKMNKEYKIKVFILTLQFRTHNFVLMSCAHDVECPRNINRLKKLDLWHGDL